MIIETTKKFDKQYANLSAGEKTKFKEKITVFRHNPHDRSLRNHGLKGKYIGYRSIDIRGDLRALYQVKGDKVILFGFIGNHSQLYG